MDLVQLNAPGREKTPPCPRENLRRRPQHAAAVTEFRAALDALDLTQNRLAQLFAVNPRTVRHWRYGDRHLTRGVAILVHLLAAGAITTSQVEQAAAASTPAQTNGGTAPEPPAPRLVEPALVPPALARAEAAALTTAEKVYAASGCRWPCGDPRDRDFRFCGRPTTAPPYCEEHRIAARMARSPSSDIKAPQRGNDGARILAPAGAN